MNDSVVVAVLVIIGGVVVWLAVAYVIAVIVERIVRAARKARSGRGERIWQKLAGRVERGEMTQDEAEYELLVKHGYAKIDGHIIDVGRAGNARKGKGKGKRK